MRRYHRVTAKKSAVEPRRCKLYRNPAWRKEEAPLNARSDNPTAKAQTEKKKGFENVLAAKEQRLRVEAKL